MGICPNCGSWVEDGDVCNFCGGSSSQNENHDDCSEESSGGFQKPKKEHVPAREIKNYLKSNRWFDDEIWGNVGLDVLEALNRYDDGAYATVSNINELIGRELRHRKFHRMKLDVYKNICVEFVRQDEYVDVVTGKVYMGGVFDPLDEYERYLDTRIRDIPELRELVRQAESEGFRYEGISSYASYRPESATLRFIKEEYHFRSYAFNFKDGTWEISYESSYPCRLLGIERDTPEKRLLLEEIERVENELGRRFHSCNGSIFKFANSSNRMFYHRYDDIEHRLNLEASCSFEDSEDYDGKYGFLLPY